MTTPSRSWRERASCNDADPELFFPDGEEGVAARNQLELAREVCRSRPVRSACLTAALEADAQHGMWGGVTAEERRTLKRRKEFTAASTSPYTRSLNYATVG